MRTVKKTGKAKRESNLTSWKKGEPSPNPKGRGKGQRNYATIYREAMIKIGEAQNKTPEEIETMLVQSGLTKAFKDFKFYQDTMDRLHGKPKQGVDMKLSGSVSLVQATMEADD